jgi:hypothetical protein
MVQFLMLHARRRGRLKQELSVILFWSLMRSLAVAIYDPQEQRLNCWCQMRLSPLCLQARSQSPAARLKESTPQVVRWSLRRATVTCTKVAKVVASYSRRERALTLLAVTRREAELISRREVRMRVAGVTSKFSVVHRALVPVEVSH